MLCCESVPTAPHRSKNPFFPQSDTNRQRKQSLGQQIFLSNSSPMPKIYRSESKWKSTVSSIESPVLPGALQLCHRWPQNPAEGSEAVVSPLQGFSLGWKTSLGLHLSLGQTFLESQRLWEAWKGNNNGNEPSPLHKWQRNPLVMAG